MKKRIIPILILMLAVVAISGCIFTDNILNDNKTKNYTGYSVSFNYPGDWIATSDNTTGIRNVIVHKKTNTTFNPTQMQIQLMPNNGMSEQGAIDQFQNSQTPGWTKLASNNLTIDGKTAYETVYSVNDTHYSQLMKFHQIVFVKNDTTYVMLLQAPDTEFDQNKPVFDMILNSFKVS